MSKKIILFIMIFLLYGSYFVNDAYAGSCRISTKNLQYENRDGNKIFITSDSQSIISTLTDDVYAYIAGSGCSSPQYNFKICYRYGDNWRGCSESGWSTKNNSYRPINYGARLYTVGFYVDAGDDSTVDDSKQIYFFYHTISNQFTIGSQNRLLNGAVISPWYQEVLGPEIPGQPGQYYLPDYYLLIGTDSSISSNRSPDDREIKIPAEYITWESVAGSPTWQIKFKITNFPVPTALDAGTTYYWRLRQQGMGTTLYIPGNTFTTPPPLPTVTTLNPTSVATNSVTLNAKANPNGGSTTGWFRYSTNSSFICDDQDLSGTRFPATGGVDLGAGKSEVNFSQTIPLSKQGVHYFCAIAENSGGKTLGQKRSFANSNRVFITSRWIKGNMFEGGGGLDGADFFCRSKASVARLGGTWKAWLSDSRTSAAERLAHFDYPYNLVDGTVIANNWADLTDGNLAQKINKTELNIASDGIVTWSNTTSDGSIDSTTNTCSNWTSTNGSGNTGHNGFTDLQWTKWGSASCNDYAPLYCFEQSLLNNADLKTSGVALNTGTLIAGNNITLKGTVWNIGSIAAIGNIKNRFDIDTNSTSFLSADVILMPYTTFDELAPGAAQSVSSAQWSNIPAGTHTIRLCADQPDPVIAESDESNNCTTSSLTVAAPTSTPTPAITGTPTPTPTTGPGTPTPTPSSSNAPIKTSLTCNPCTKDNIPFNSDHLYYIKGDLNISGNNDGTGSGVVFVEGNLNFTGNYCYGAAGATTGLANDCLNATLPGGTIGTVFIVKGDINIAPAVTRIDAVLIVEGTIYTAGAGCTTSKVSASQLVINGNLISLKHPDPNQINPPSAIRFCRTFSNNSQAAEVINHQVKYLVILRDLMSDTLQRWSEIP